MKRFDIVPVASNPSTAQIIIPGLKGAPSAMPPLRSEEDKLPDVGCDGEHCNDCIFFVKIRRPNKESYNTRCSAENPRPGGAYKVVKLNVYENEKVKKPFWCPLTKSNAIGGLINKPKIDRSDSQERHELWKSAPGITAWADIKVGEKYHLPPTPKNGRMDLIVKVKYANSIQCDSLTGQKRVWLYKDDEDYKFLSPLC